MQAILAGGRVGLVAAIVIAVLAPMRVLAAPACDTTIRVLLDRRDSAFSVASGGESHSFELSSRGQLRVNGVRKKHWRSEIDGARLGGRRVPGTLSVVPLDQGLALIAEIPLEAYVAGVLMGEVPASWKAEALRAQAVASRSYGLHQRGIHARRAYHVEGNTRGQVFELAPPRASITRAVRATRCEVLTWQGLPILAAYHSASGGRTASSREVWGQHLAYLTSTEVKGEENSPDTYWRMAVSRTTMGEVLEAIGRGVGEIWAAQVLARSESGRVLRLRFKGSRGETRLSGGKLRAALGESTLKSTLFELSFRDDVFVFVGSGRGHGVGMSQWGAQGMARRGAVYTDILESFFPGTKLTRWGRHFGDTEEFAGG
jgi:stage II sporulation protein D